MPGNPRLKLQPDGPYIEIDGGALFLGRDCHLVQHIPAFNNRVVSNRHCCVKKEPDGRWTIEDLGSTNGTWLRGRRLAKREVLVSGDTFVLGRNGPKFLCELPIPEDPSATLLEDEIAEAATLMEEKPDGSAERPFRVGRTPEVSLHHQRTGKDLTAKGYTIVVGRSPEAQIVIRSDEERHISSRHAEIQFRSDGHVVLRDLESRNGSWVNDRKVAGEVTIKVGDKVVLGAEGTTLLVKRLDM